MICLQCLQLPAGSVRVWGQSQKMRGVLGGQLGRRPASVACNHTNLIWSPRNILYIDFLRVLENTNFSSLKTVSGCPSPKDGAGP
jgi:hypothetical protein